MAKHKKRRGIFARVSGRFLLLSKEAAQLLESDYVRVTVTDRKELILQPVHGDGKIAKVFVKDGQTTRLHSKIPGLLEMFTNAGRIPGVWDDINEQIVFKFSA